LFHHGGQPLFGHLSHFFLLSLQRYNNSSKLENNGFTDFEEKDGKSFFFTQNEAIRMFSAFSKRSRR